MTIVRNETESVTVDELNEAQARDLFARVCRERLNVSPEEFFAAQAAGEYPEAWDQRQVSHVEMLLPFAR